MNTNFAYLPAEFVEFQASEVSLAKRLKGAFRVAYVDEYTRRVEIVQPFEVNGIPARGQIGFCRRKAMRDLNSRVETYGEKFECDYGTTYVRRAVREFDTEGLTHTSYTIVRDAAERALILAHETSGFVERGAAVVAINDALRAALEADKAAEAARLARKASTAAAIEARHHVELAYGGAASPLIREALARLAD